MVLLAIAESSVAVFVRKRSLGGRATTTNLNGRHPAQRSATHHITAPAGREGGGGQLSQPGSHLHRRHELGLGEVDTVDTEGLLHKLAVLAARSAPVNAHVSLRPI
eukprot:SAG25_NODE_395_length_8553_cov_4.407263_13_plen_106_part_00